jgi:UPF0042 nucleotide-binding protein
MTERPVLEASAASAPSGVAAPPLRRLVVVTGMSGAGKTTALKALEDLGYEAVDNLPLSLVGQLIRPIEGVVHPIAVGIDTRTRDFAAEIVASEIDRLKADPSLEVKLLFLDCEDDALCRRFTETRRRHPLATDRPLLDGILYERRLVSPLRERADVVIDTSNQPSPRFKRMLDAHFRLEIAPSLLVFVTSFAYRGGVPREADMVFDVRFLDNPHYDPNLKPLTGRDPQVADFVARDRDFVTFFEAMASLLATLLPRYAAEGKSYLTIAIGCTGGRHRSVVVAEKLASWLRDRNYRVDLRHREIEDGGA